MSLNLGNLLNPLPAGQSSIWRPPQWSPNGPQPIMLIVPAQQGIAQYSQSGAPQAAPSGMFVFDANLRLVHGQRFTKTRHPVQTGANISDHIYVEPASLVIDVGMSDAMDQYSAGMWVGNPSKSVSCYQTMLAIGYARVPFTIVTRLRTYYNMAIVNLPAEETNKTVLGLRGSFEFEQVFVASTSQSSTSTQSARPQTTNSTNLGTTTPQSPTTAEETQYNTEGSGDGSGGDSIIRTGALSSQSTYFGPTQSQAWNTQGAGNWSSVNTNNLNQSPN